jgi:hypothetical protein
MHSPQLKNSKDVSLFHPIFSGYFFDKDNNDNNDDMLNLFIPVKVVKVYDGDTVTIQFHLFNDKNMPIVKYNARLYGIDTAEIKGGTEESKKLANKAKSYVKNLVDLNNLMFAKFEPEADKYGRMLIRLYSDYEHEINKQLIELELAVPYYGGKKDTTSFS